jgi:hypothetical protein
VTSTEIPNPTGWFPGLLSRLGISRFGKWFLSDTVLPVALVDASAVTLNSLSVSQLLGAPSTAGELVAPAINTRLADTGQLAAGNWNLRILLSSDEGNGFKLRRRNAADAADIWSHRLFLNQPGAAAAGTVLDLTLRVSVAANERFVIENSSIAGTGAHIYQASIWASQ